MYLVVRHHLIVLMLAVYSIQQAVGSVASKTGYAVIIDAGSTGSRAHVFKYSTTGGDAAAYPVVELPEPVLKVSPGLSAYASDPKKATHSLDPLLAFAREKVPVQQWKQTPIAVMATAGVRMLGNSTAQQITSEVNKLLASSGFEHRTSAGGGARVLTGTEEGLLGWVAFNYASGALQAASSKPLSPPQVLGRKDPPVGTSSSTKAAAALLGVLELGGGSLQVTFVPQAAPPPAEAAALALPSLGAGRLYSRSFDGVGLQAAMKQWSTKLAQKQTKQDPCLPVGLKASSRGVTGSGDWQACKAGVVQLVPQKPCVFKTCGPAGTFLPALEGTTFMGVDNFHYTAQTLNLPTNRPVSVDDIDKAAATFCKQAWSHIWSPFSRRHKGDPAESFHARLCFSAALIISLLKDGLHFPPSKPVLVASNSVSTPAGRTLEAKWPLGALVVQLMNTTTTPSSTTSKHPPMATSKQQQGQGQQPPPQQQQQQQQPGKQQPGRLQPKPQPQQAQQGSGPPSMRAPAVAAIFCVVLFALSLCASWMGVGLASSNSSSSRGSGGSWLGRWQRLQSQAAAFLGLQSSASRADGSSNISGSSGSSGRVRYIRMSRSDGWRLRAGSASPPGSSSDAAGDPESGSLMMAEFPARRTSDAAGNWAGEGGDGSKGVTSSKGVTGSKGVTSSKGVTGNVNARPLSARQR